MLTFLPNCIRDCKHTFSGHAYVPLAKLRETIWDKLQSTGHAPFGIQQNQVATDDHASNNQSRLCRFNLSLLLSFACTYPPKQEALLTLLPALGAIVSKYRNPSAFAAGDGLAMACMQAAANLHRNMLTQVCGIRGRCPGGKSSHHGQSPRSPHAVAARFCNFTEPLESS